VRPIVIIITVLAPSLVAMPRSSSDYSLAPEIVDGGGLRGTSAFYTASFSTGPGGVGASANYTVQGGFAGQLDASGNTDPPVLYQQWMADNALTGGNALPAMDADGDGLINLQEFAFGSDPSAATGAITIDAAGNVTNPKGSPIAYLGGITATSVDFRAVFARRKEFAAAALVYNVQFSADLIGWHDHPALPIIMNGSAPDIDLVFVRFPLFVITGRGFEKPRFFRIGVRFSE
jgi:hypothetical protein